MTIRKDIESGIVLDRKSNRAEICLDVEGDILHTSLTFGDHELIPTGRLQERLDLFLIGQQIETIVVYLTSVEQEDTHIWISSVTDDKGWPFPLDDDTRDFFVRILRDIL
jgi:hypothetical protein